MDSKIERILTIILYISVIFTFSFSITFNTQNKIILGLISSVLIVTVSVRHVIVYPSEKYHNIGKFMILIDLALIYWIVIFDKSGISQLYLLALISEAVIYNPAAYSLLVAASSFITYTISNYIKYGYTSLADFIPSIVGSIISFIFVYGTMYLTKHQINQRRKLSQALKEIEVKNSQLEKAYQKLKQNSEVIEEVTALKERNRIAREIHDTVGHTLTTVLIEIEAGKRLILKNSALAEEKLELAQDQVRKGLSDIRISVKMLQDRGAVMEFQPALESLIHETEKHADVIFQKDISLEAALSADMEKLLYNALMEGITNGIKHGGASKFTFTLHAKDGMISFRLENNGSSCDSIVPGFGLTAMRDKVEAEGGTLSIASSFNGGCTLSISIPINE